MTSRISFFKMVKSDLKRRLWVIALLFLGYFLVMPIQSVMRLEQLQDSLIKEYIKYDELLFSVKYMVGAGNAGIIFGVIISALLAAFSGFSYLHSSRKTDLFHSFAVKREHLFLVQYISGLITFLVPYGINLVLMMLVCVTNGVITGAVIGSALGGVLVSILFFLLIYHVTMIAIFMTGKLLVSGLATIVFCGWAFLISQTVMGYCYLCLGTYYELRQSIFEKVLGYLSPLGLYLESAGVFSSDHFTGTDILVAAIEVVLLFAAALWLYKKRPAEAAGNSMAFPKWNPVIKVCILIPLSAFGGLFANEVSGNTGIGWLLFGIIFVAVVVHCLIEVIYSYDFRKVFSHKITFCASLIAVLLFAAIFWFDLTGYDERMPECEDLQSMAVSIEGIDCNIDYLLEHEDSAYDQYAARYNLFNRYNYYDAKEIYRLENGQMTDVTAAYQLAKYGVENEKTGYFDKGDEVSGMDMVVSYIDHSGKETIRRYLISYEQLNTCISALYATENFKKGQYPLLDLDVEDMAIDKIRFNDAYHIEEEMDLTLEEKKELISCYQKELMSASYEEMQGKDVVASFGICNIEDSSIASTYFIYESFTETIAYMEEHGYPIHRVPDIKDVSSISVYNYEWEEEQYALSEKDVVLTGEASGERVFDDPEDIRQILDAMSVDRVDSYQAENYEVRVSIDFDGEKGKTHMEILGYFLKDNVPQCVLDAYED